MEGKMEGGVINHALRLVPVLIFIHHLTDKAKDKYLTSNSNPNIRFPIGGNRRKPTTFGRALTDT